MSKKIGIGVNLQLGNQLKRIYFAVFDNPVAMAKFDELCMQINSWDEKIDMHMLIHMVVHFLEGHGFEWIPK